MQKILKKNRKAQGFMAILLIVIIVLAIGGGAWAITSNWDSVMGFFSSGGSTEDVGTDHGDWTDSFVYFQISSSNQFNGTAMNPNIEIYTEEPTSCWENPRELTCEENFEATGTLTSGTKTFQELFPGDYFVVTRHTGYYSEYSTITIPSGPESSTESLSDYNSAPASSVVKMRRADTLTTTNITLDAIAVNNTAKEITETASYTTADDKCVDIWKVQIFEVDDSLTDAGSQVSHEGVKKVEIAINGGAFITIIDLPSSITQSFNEDGENQKFEIDLENKEISICDGDGLELKVRVKLDARFDGGAIDDKKFNNNDSIGNIKIFDRLGTSIPSSNYISVVGSTR